MLDSPTTGARRGQPHRARWARWWTGSIAVGVLLCGVAAAQLLGAPGSAASGGQSVVTSSELSAPATSSVGTGVPLPESGASIAGPRAVPDVITTAETPTAEALETTAAPLADVPVAITLGDGAQPIRVVPIGVSSSGVLLPPDDPSTVGWWVAGPRPAQPGRTVITGHIDSQASGLGAFAALDDLRPGDHLTLTTVDRTTLRYVVTARDQIEKTALDPATLTGTSASDLVLVTCIGNFDRTTHHYDSNLLITAVPE